MGDVRWEGMATGRWTGLVRKGGAEILWAWSRGYWMGSSATGSTISEEACTTDWLLAEHLYPDVHRSYS